jgi:hypothetical protein
MKKYILTDIDETLGYSSNTVRITLTWRDIDTLDTYITTIDPSYRNYKSVGWHHFLKDSEPWGVYYGMVASKRASKRGEGILDADSLPQLDEHLSKQDVEDYVRWRQQQLDAKPAKSNVIEIHNGLFTIELPK